MRELVADLSAEQAVLIRLLDGLPTDAWDRPSPADGWLLRDCVSHLAELDGVASYVAEGNAFREAPKKQPRAEAPKGLTAGQQWGREQAPAVLLGWYREEAERLQQAVEPLDAKARLPWAGPPMSARSFTTARLMEHWSHGLDIHDAAGAAPVDSGRLRHIAHIGFITRDFAYTNRGREAPRTRLRVELRSPDGETWTWGPSDAEDRVTGPAGDWCRVVTQRIHPSDTDLRSEGPHAREFLGLAQAFAGPPGAGRQPTMTTKEME
jgi:uncharacterized protein (TIGR03084 family)